MHQENGPQDPPNPAKTWQSTQYANIVLHAPSEIYYARLRVKGKLLWRSLKTSKISIAKLRLSDLEKEERKKSEAGFVQAKDKILMSDCLAAYRQKGFRPAKPRHKQDVRPLKPAAIFYYEQQVKGLLKTWPGLEHLEVRHLTEKDCADWAGRARQMMAPSVFNHTLGILRNLFEFGIQAGARYHNPALAVMRESERPKHLVLPDEATFGRFVAEIEAGQSRLSRDCANLVRFMAYGGLRRTEAAYVKGADCDFERGIITLRGHPETGLKNRPAGETRPVPMIRNRPAVPCRFRNATCS